LRAAGRVGGDTLIHPGVGRHDAEDAQAAAVDDPEVVAGDDGIAVLEPRDRRRRVADGGAAKAHVAVHRRRGVARSRHDPRRHCRNHRQY